MNTARISLRDYQRSLTARLARQDGRQTVSKLGVRAANGGWLVDLADAGEVIPLPPVTRVPLAKPWFAGLANVRGRLCSVIDFSAFLGMDRTAADSQSRLVLVAEKHRVSCGLVVQAALGLYRDEQLTRVDGDAASPWVAAHCTDTQGSAWKLLDMHRLVTHPVFLDVSL
jgi:twitching motility protein PilI